MSTLDALSDALAIASLIPGVDTFADMAAIPVDLLRGDYLSAGLDLFGILPFVGEVADTARLARVADKAIDAAKAVNKASNFSKFPKQIHAGRQGKHIIGHNNYRKGKSVLTISNDTAQELVYKYSGTGKKINANTERVNFKRVIGKYVDEKTGKAYDTTMGTIRYSKNGVHIVPAKPINWRE